MVLINILVKKKVVKRAFNKLSIILVKMKQPIHVSIHQ